jgi:hypothetical protein
MYELYDSRRLKSGREGVSGELESLAVPES